MSALYSSLVPFVLIVYCEVRGCSLFLFYSSAASTSASHSPLDSPSASPSMSLPLPSHWIYQFFFHLQVPSVFQLFYILLISRYAAVNFGTSGWVLQKIKISFYFAFDILPLMQTEVQLQNTTKGTVK